MQFCNPIILAVALLFSLTHPVLAEGDPVAGRQKAETCFGCHAAPDYFNVYPSYRVPKLAGQFPEYIIQALKDYQSGARSHPTMQANAANLTEQDMADLAAFLSTAK